MRAGIIRPAVALSAALVLLLLGGCAPQMVGEEAAREAGLVLLRQAFGVNDREARVEYFERAGTCIVDNAEVRGGSDVPTRIYLVTIADQTDGADLYYSEVDAETGVAYYAMKNERLLTPMTCEQREQADELAAMPDREAAEHVRQGEATETAVCDQLVCRFQKEIALISPQEGCCGRQSPLSSRACLGYFVTFADGAMYRVVFSWPTLELEAVHSLGMDDTGGENP